MPNPENANLSMKGKRKKKKKGKEAIRKSSQALQLLFSPDLTGSPPVNPLPTDLCIYQATQLHLGLDLEPGGFQLRKAPAKARRGVEDKKERIFFFHFFSIFFSSELPTTAAAEISHQTLVLWGRGSTQREDVCISGRRIDSKNFTPPPKGIPY